MTVLVRQKVGRRTCNSRCYNAKGNRCQCICEGKNHGIGLYEATRITGELAEELIDKGLEPVPQTYFKELVNAGKGQKGRSLLESGRSNLLHKWKSFWNSLKF